MVRCQPDDVFAIRSHTVQIFTLLDVHFAPVLTLSSEWFSVQCSGFSCGRSRIRMHVRMFLAVEPNNSSLQRSGSWEANTNWLNIMRTDKKVDVIMRLPRTPERPVLGRSCIWWISTTAQHRQRTKNHMRPWAGEQPLPYDMHAAPPAAPSHLAIMWVLHAACSLHSRTPPETGSNCRAAVCPFGAREQACARACTRRGVLRPRPARDTRSRTGWPAKIAAYLYAIDGWREGGKYLCVVCRCESVGFFYDAMELNKPELHKHTPTRDTK